MGVYSYNNMSRHEEAANDQAAIDAERNTGIDSAKSRRLANIQKAINKRNLK